jgi:hypothetical protein
VPAIVWGEERLDLPMLQIPLKIREEYATVVALREKIARKEIKRTKRGMEDWIRGGLTPVVQRQRRRMMNITMDFLDGGVLEDAETKLYEHYEQYISTDAKARAAQLVAAPLLRNKGATFVATDDGDEWIVPLLPGWCLGGVER